MYGQRDLTMLNMAIGVLFAQKNELPPNEWDQLRKFKRLLETVEASASLKSTLGTTLNSAGVAGMATCGKPRQETSKVENGVLFVQECRHIQLIKCIVLPE
jgi:hypothetical protein